MEASLASQPDHVQIIRVSKRKFEIIHGEFVSFEDNRYSNWCWQIMWPTRMQDQYPLTSTFWVGYKSLFFSKLKTVLLAEYLDCCHQDPTIMGTEMLWFGKHGTHDTSIYRSQTLGNRGEIPCHTESQAHTHQPPHPMQILFSQLLHPHAPSPPTPRPPPPIQPHLHQLLKMLPLLPMLDLPSIICNNKNWTSSLISTNWDCTVSWGMQDWVAYRTTSGTTFNISKWSKKQTFWLTRMPLLLSHLLSST